MNEKYAGCRNYEAYRELYTKEYTVRGLPLDEWPEVVPLNDRPCVENFAKKNYSCDANGGVVFTVGNTTIFKPVFVAQAGLNAIRAYMECNESQYIKFAERQALYLLSQALEHGDSLQFPYSSDLSLAKLPGDEHVMKAPWYSGMAQGQILSLFSILFNITENSEYLDAACKVFNGYYDRCDGYGIWLIYHDELGFCWIEEYPQPYFPCNTLNGMIFSMFGVYNFYQVAKSIDAHELFQKCLRTIEFYMPQFRVNGGISFYDLKYGRQNKSYHRIHSRQMLVLYKLTGERFFVDMANLLRQDYWQFD